jgi:hypothetical protein
LDIRTFARIPAGAYSGEMPTATTHDDPGVFTLKVWRLHPDGCRIVPAERTLDGTAPHEAVRFCGPFTHANAAGFWVYPPVDIDIVWRGGQDFEWDLLTPYSDADDRLIRLLVDDGVEVNGWLPPGGRTKLTWGLVETGVVQIWTGCIFQTPPGWALHLRSPVNVPPAPAHVMEAMLESDWLQYDIWLNLAFDRRDEMVSLRRDQWPPVAQLLPVARDAYEAPWRLESELVNRNSPEAERVFEYFVEYNTKKFASGGRHPRSYEDPEARKDSSTYFKERKRIRGRGQ